MSAEVKISGPLFDGKAAKAVHDFCDEAKQEIGKHVANEIRNELGKVLKHPTGHYKSQIHTDRKSTSNRVTDGGVVYGPWLEGVGSRNKRSRFKGYSTFRRVAQKLKGQATKDAEKLLPKHLGKMS